MSTLNVHGAGHGFYRSLERQAIDAAAQGAGPRSGEKIHDDKKVEGSEHRHHGHHYGQLFRKIEQAVTSALQSLPSDGSGDANKAITDAIVKALGGTPAPAPTGNPGTPPPAGDPGTTPPPGDPGTTPPTESTPPPGDTSGSTTTTGTTPADTTGQTSSTTGATSTTASSPSTTTGSTSTASAPGTGSSAGSADPDGDGDTDAGPAEASHHPGRHTLFHLLQSFGITAEQFRQDLLAAIKQLRGTQADATNTVQNFPPGTTVDTTT